MNGSSSVRWQQLFLVALLTAWFSGCSDDTERLAPENIENLRQIQQAYMKACQELKRPPASRDELVNYLPANTDVASLFRSPNDDQEYVIIWGADPFGPIDVTSGPKVRPLVIGYEKEGRDGMRYVFLATGVVQMANDEFAGANFPDGHSL